jgi:polyhydroxyalkanoate synthase subunit PhaC
MSEDWAEDAVDAAGGLDLLLTDAALGVWRRLRPDSSLLRLAAGLGRRPELVGRQAALLAAELGRIAAGRSAVAAGPRDRRFADPAWTANPVLRRIVQAYLAAAGSADELLAGAELGWRDDTRLRFLLANLIAAAAPSNNPLLSPVGWRAVIETRGENAVRGLRALASDLATSPRVPSMVPPDAFEVGRDLAVTPGGVVYATEVFELIQYQPVTETVHRYPLLIVPPMINKYYIVDLAPGRSMVEFLVGQGHQVFVMSWRNPDARHRDWGLDTYGTALTDALAVVRAITAAAKASVCALCSGGIMASMVAAHLAVTGQLDQLATLCLGVTVLDQSPPGRSARGVRAGGAPPGASAVVSPGQPGPGTAGAFIDEKTAAAAMAVSSARGYLDGRALAEVFAWLRPDDLIWNYWVNNYLQGLPPPAFDILYWNADVTRLPAALHHDFLRLGMTNALTTPGAAIMLGSPADLAKVDLDAYVVAGMTDHLCPWESCYRTTQLLGGPVRFVLSTSGHIAAMVNPPGNPKAAYRATPAGTAVNPADPREFLAEAATVPGSWWTDYSSWLAERGGGERKSPRTLGRKAYPVRSAAPGTYVHDR